MEKTHSQFYANWVHELFNMDDEKIFIRREDFLYNQTYLYGSLPLEQAIRACKNMYTYELAKITIEISDPVVMTIQKRISSTFSEQLGVVGGAENNLSIHVVKNILDMGLFQVELSGSSQEWA